MSLCKLLIQPKFTKVSTECVIDSRKRKQNLEMILKPEEYRSRVRHFAVVLVAKPEDMARALLMNAVQNLASMTVWTALAKNCRTVYICGGVFEHKLPRDLFFYFFEGLAGYFGQVHVGLLRLCT